VRLDSDGVNICRCQWLRFCGEDSALWFVAQFGNDEVDCEFSTSEAGGVGVLALIVSVSGWGWKAPQAAE
jgi:hypothetical protein